MGTAQVWWLYSAQTVSGRPPPAASMAVGQFFNPEEGETEFSPSALLLSTYSQKVASAIANF